MLDKVIYPWDNPQSEVPYYLDRSAGKLKYSPTTTFNTALDSAVFSSQSVSEFERPRPSSGHSPQWLSRTPTNLRKREKRFEFLIKGSIGPALENITHSAYVGSVAELTLDKNILAI